MIRVAFDSGPLHGPRTGIGHAVQRIIDSLDAEFPEVELRPYLVSYRSRPEFGIVRLPYPAALALRVWARFDTPRPDRHFGDVDVVHGTNYVAPPSRHPRVVSVYDCWALDNPSDVHRDVRLMMGALRRSIDTGAHVHASSHATAHRLREHFPTAKISVIHLGAPAAISLATTGASTHTTAIPEDGRVILAVGTVERRKNLPFIASLIDDIVGMVPDARLVIAGAPGADQAALDRARDASEHRDRIHVLGRVDAATLDHLMRRARVLVYPSLDEGFGFPILEAMVASIPVIASTAGSIPEIAGDAALLRSVDDRDGWIDALVRTLTDDDERERLVTAGLARSVAFDWSRTATELAALYAKVADVE
jgi:glycosyltransferase involved in cell wall biosynthesis